MQTLSRKSAGSVLENECLFELAGLCVTLFLAVDPLLPELLQFPCHSETYLTG